MRLWHVYLKTPSDHRDPDSLQGVVVRAEDEDDARDCATTKAGDEGMETWWDPDKTVCTPLTDDGERGVICADFWEA